MLYPATLLYHWLALVIFWWCLQGFLCRGLCHLQTVSFTSFPFWIPFISFSWSPLPNLKDKSEKMLGVRCCCCCCCEVTSVVSDSVRPIDSIPSGSPVPGILQARTLEWVAISFSIAWKWKVIVKSLSQFRLLATPWAAAHQAPPSMGFSRQEYWSGVPSPSPYSTMDYCKITAAISKAL